MSGGGMWKLGSLSGKGEEVCEDLRKRMIDVCVVCRSRDGEDRVLRCWG